MRSTEIRDLAPGANQSGVRAHNERLILSLIHRHGSMAAADIAKRTELSAQTVSNILRKLETEGFVLRREPQRGRVGKPSVPMALDPDGALAFGLKIGRRSSDLAVMTLTGEVLAQRQVTYRYPMPRDILSYLESGMAELSAALHPHQRNRLCGIGIAAPFEMWSWADTIGAPDEFGVWRDTDVAAEVARFSALPTYLVNDATAACRAELLYGRGREFGDFAYFYVGSFIGGGVVLNSSVVEGGRHNAGALGSLRTVDADGEERPLIDTASLFLLETEIARAGGDAAQMWRLPQDWSAFAAQLQPWIATSALQIAKAGRNACAVIDFEAILIDGAFPPDVRRALVMRTREAIQTLDMRGLIMPKVEEAQAGGNARVIGAATAPLVGQYFLT